jgi:hypothetical protein
VVDFANGEAKVQIKEKQKKSKSSKLTVAQIKTVGQFNDYRHENPKLNFEQVVRKQLGSNPFPRTPNDRRFEKECREVFDRE